MSTPWTGPRRGEPPLGGAGSDGGQWETLWTAGGCHWSPCSKAPPTNGSAVSSPLAVLPVAAWSFVSKILRHSTWAD